MEYAPLLEGFLQEVYWEGLALSMLTQYTDLKQDGSFYR